MPAGDDGAGVAHAASRRRGLSGNERDDWLGHICFGKLRRFFFSGAAEDQGIRDFPRARLRSAMLSAVADALFVRIVFLLP